MSTLKSIRHILLELLVILAAVVFMYPLVLILLNSFKTYKEVMNNVVAFPLKFEFGNYARAWAQMRYLAAFGNTLIVTVFGTIGIVLISSMAGYKLSRIKSKISSFLFILCITPMIIPFQTIMITLVKMAKNLHLINSLQGLIVICWGLGAPLAIFLYHGFVKSIPAELEECAQIDGCSRYRSFFNIVFPLLKPVTSTVVVLTAMWLWNDFMLPLLIINSKKSLQTLQLASYVFFGEYVNEWQVACAGMIMCLIPIVLFFVFMQKYIINGITAGAVKG